MIIVIIKSFQRILSFNFPFLIVYTLCINCPFNAHYLIDCKDYHLILFTSFEFYFGIYISNIIHCMPWFWIYSLLCKNRLLYAYSNKTADSCHCLVSSIPDCARKVEYAIAANNLFFSLACLQEYYNFQYYDLFVLAPFIKLDWSEK